MTLVDSHTIAISFPGAKISRRERYSSAGRSRIHAFRGWAGTIKEWPAGESPVIDFGGWSKDPRNEDGGGTVTFSAPAGALIMWGANAPGMDRRDKTTHFGIAGLGDERILRPVRLPEGQVAREIFEAGGWPIADVSAEVAAIGQIYFGGEAPAVTGERLLQLVLQAFEKLTLRCPRGPLKGENLATVRKEMHERLPKIGAAWAVRQDIASLTVITLAKLNDWEEARQERRLKKL